MKPIDPFYHPQPVQGQVQPQLFGDPQKPQPVPNVPQGSSYGILQDLVALNVGRGKYGWHISRQGMCMGDEDFAKAPFSVDMNGRATFRDPLGVTIVDAGGIKSDTQFLTDELEDFTDRQTTSATPKTIANTTVDFILQRPTNLLIPVTVSAYISGLAGGDAGADPVGIVQLVVDGVVQPYKIKFQDIRMYDAETAGLTISRTFTESYDKIVQLAAGAHTISLIFYLLTASSYALHVSESSIGYITFGK